MTTALMNQRSRAQRPRPLVLCIDDDPEIPRTIGLRLSRYKVEVQQAFFGMHGIYLAVTEQPDAIITDLRMPQGTGGDVVEWLKRNPHTKDIPVIVFSGKQRHGLQREMRSLGAAKFIAKPAHFEELLEALREFIPLVPPEAEPD